MFKKLIILLILVFSICLMNISKISGEEEAIWKDKFDLKYDYIDFLNAISLLRSMSVHYLPSIYPDMLYVGPSYTWFTHQKVIGYAKKDLDTILIDLKWGLNENWFWGIYSEIYHKAEDHVNDSYPEDKNPMDTDIGIIFIYKF